ncbi:MAG: hypothetical protein QM754_06915 [Tepidisphaeraceae bacterium]
MKAIGTIFVSMLAVVSVGCASHSDKPEAAQLPREYQPSSASALAFEPPVAIGQPMPSFDRDGRSIAAFAGYEEQVTTYSYTHQRDEIRVYNDFGSLERRAFSDRTTINTR